MLEWFFVRLRWWPLADQVLLGAGAVVLLAAVARLIWESGGEVAVTGGGAPPPALSAWPAALPQLPAEALVALVQAAPFRAERAPAPRRYRLETAGVSEESRAGPVAMSPAPGYRLRGLATLGGVGLAVIEGSSGRPGPRVYRLHDSLDEWRVARIAGDSVVLAGSDTAIVLKINRPWEH